MRDTHEKWMAALEISGIKRLDESLGQDLRVSSLGRYQPLF